MGLNAESSINQIEQNKFSEILSKFTNNLIIVDFNYNVKMQKYGCKIKKTGNDLSINEIND